MSEATTISVQPTIDRIVLRAYKKAGLIPITSDIGNDVEWEAKASHGRETLTSIVDGLSVHGFLEYFVDFYDLELTEDELQYCLDPDVLNVVSDGSYIPASNEDTLITNGETQVSQISAFRWNQLSSKESRGRPSQMYVHRNGKTIELRVWPRPDENGTIRLRIHRIPFSSQVGSNNVDLHRYWLDYLIHALAYQLMTDSKLPMDERVECKMERDSMLEHIKNYASSNEGPVVVSVHTTPYQRGYRR